MAGVGPSIIGSYKSALSVPVTVTAVIPAPTVNVAGPSISLTAITKAEMQEVMAAADQDTLNVLEEVRQVLESIKLGMQIATEEELEIDG